MKYLLTLPLIAFLSACQVPAPATPQGTVLQSCTVYGRSLSLLAAARYQGRLNADQIASVDALNTVVLPVCTASYPPADAQATLDSANRALEALIFQTGAQ